MNGSLTDHVSFISGIIPINLATGANTGYWVSVRNARALAFILFKAAGGAGEPVVITALQATAAAGTGSKALAFTRIVKKQGADLTAVGIDTEVIQSAANTYSVTGDEQAIVVIEIPATAFDATNGFVYASVTIADVGNTAQIGGVLYGLVEPSYKNPVTSPLT